MFPTYMTGKHEQASSSIVHPRNPPGGKGEKGVLGPREYTHTHMGVHENI